VIQANAVIAGKIDADAVTAREIAANTITAAEIAANTITAAQIAASTITSNEIAANTITAADIAANTITASEIAANTITANEIAANTITATEIAADAITTTELAANAVITENLLAANVTSSKIELTISGKNFGANAGSAAAPGVYFDSSTNTGLYYESSTVRIANGGSPKWDVGTASNTTRQHILPGSDNLYGIGNTLLRFTDVWAVDGTINTSDGNLKRDVADSPLGLSFVRSLKPRVYRWRDTVDTEARTTAEAQYNQAAVDSAVRPHAATIARSRRLLQETPSNDPRAEQALRDVADAQRAIVEIRRQAEQPLRDAATKRRPGQRQHYGLIAQEVKAALDAAGVDAAFWKVGPNGVQAIAYAELVAPMLKAIQELDRELQEVKQSLNQQHDD